MLKLHNAMWPGLVGKGEPGTEPAISMESMLDLTAAAEVNGGRYDGVDFFMFDPHFNIHASDDEIRKVADQIAERGFKIGTVVAPVWPGTLGASAMGDDAEQKKFLHAIEIGCRVAKVFNQHGVRSYGCIRIDSATSPVEWAKDPVAGTKRIAATFREAATIAADHGEKLAAEGEICWAAMHSWKDMLELLELVDRPDVVGFQADLAHTYLYMLGVNASEHALLSDDYSDEQFWEAYKTMTDKLGPWTIDFHVAQSNGTVHGSGSHDKTGRHCPADAKDGKLDIVECARYWLLDEQRQIRNNIQHICWDGCMFPNETLEDPNTWNVILKVMREIQTDIGSTGTGNEG